MNTIEDVHCTAAIGAVLAANWQLMHASVGEALRPIARHTPDKPDTLGLDGIPESTIANSLKRFDPGAVLITEEIGATSVLNWRGDRHAYLPATIYVSDPTDRSAQLKAFLSKQKDTHRILGDIVQADDAVTAWENEFGAPASITGATSSITCVRYGSPINAVLVNFITQELFVAFRAGVFCLKLPAFKSLEPTQITLDQIKSQGTPVNFRRFQESGGNMENMKRFVTFLGKTGYLENLRDSDLINLEDDKSHIHYDLPGGPSRVLYLSTLQPEAKPVGFILANGEKIGEWVHWLPFVRFGLLAGEPRTHEALNLYEIFHERPWTKEGILMSTPPQYSIFSKVSGYGERMAIDIERFRSFANPSRLRSTLLVAPASNTWAMTVMETHDYRQIEFADQR